MDAVNARGVALGFAVAAFLTCIAAGLMAGGAPGSLFTLTVQSARVTAHTACGASCTAAGPHVQQPVVKDMDNAGRPQEAMLSGHALNSGGNVSSTTWDDVWLPLGPDFVGGDEDMAAEVEQGDGETAHDVEDVLGLWEETFTEDPEEYHRWLDAQIEHALSSSPAAPLIPSLAPSLIEAARQLPEGSVDVLRSSPTARKLTAQKPDSWAPQLSSCTHSVEGCPLRWEAASIRWHRPQQPAKSVVEGARVGAWTLGRAVLQLAGTRINAISGITQRNIAVM